MARVMYGDSLVKAVCRRHWYLTLTALFRYTMTTLAEVAELADAHDSKSCSLVECGFDSLLRHQIPEGWRARQLFRLMNDIFDNLAQGG